MTIGQSVLAETLEAERSEQVRRSAWSHRSEQGAIRILRILLRTGVGNRVLRNLFDAFFAKPGGISG